MQRVVQPGCFIHAVLLLGPHLKRWGALLLSGRLLPGLTEAQALSITLTRASSLGSLSENFKHPHYWFLPPLHLGTGIHLPPPCMRQRGCREVVVEVEIEVKKTKRIDRKRDSEIKEKEASHNNMGDLTLLHCSTSCYLQLWADKHSYCNIHGMVIMHWNNALWHMNESNRKIICTAYILCQVIVGKAFVENQRFLAQRCNSMKKRQQSLNSSNNKGAQGETWGGWY